MKSALIRSLLIFLLFSPKLGYACDVELYELESKKLPVDKGVVSVTPDLGTPSDYPVDNGAIFPAPYKIFRVMFGSSFFKLKLYFNPQSSTDQVYIVKHSEDYNSKPIKQFEIQHRKVTLIRSDGSRDEIDNSSIDAENDKIYAGVFLGAPYRFKLVWKDPNQKRNESCESCNAELIIGSIAGFAIAAVLFSVKDFILYKQYIPTNKS